MCLSTYSTTCRQIASLVVLTARVLFKLGWLAPSYRRAAEERRRTLEGLIASLISLVAIVSAIVAVFALFVEPETLIWIVGLFSAAFGSGARGMVADFVAGGSFIFHCELDRRWPGS